MKKNILVADKIAQTGIDYLKEQGDFEVDHINGLDEAGLCGIIGKYHAVLVRSAATITTAVIDLRHAPEWHRGVRNSSFVEYSADG